MSNLISSDDPFDPAQKEVLRDIVGYMIPAGSGRPAANDDIIFADILAIARPLAEQVREVLQICQSTDLAGLSQLRHPALSALVGVTVQCYYRDERVMQSLQMEARPPHPHGYAVAAGEWQLLEPVRKRGRVYREV